MDGGERKFVICKNKKEYAEIEKTGIANKDYLDYILGNFLC